MKLSQRTSWTGIAWCLLLLLAFASFWTMRSSDSRLRAACEQLQDCEQLAADIRSFQNRPGFAALDVDSPQTITARAENAGDKADLPPAALVRIEPQAAVRLRDSAYRLRPTRLELRQVTLKQIVAFTHAMIDETQGTTVRDIRLTASDSTTDADHQTETDQWTAELVLTQLIYSPLSR